jgi:hypothetical protein
MPVYDRVKKVARSNGRDAINRAKSKVPGGLNPAGLKAALGKAHFLGDDARVGERTNGTPENAAQFP